MRQQRSSDADPQVNLEDLIKAQSLASYAETFGAITSDGSATTVVERVADMIESRINDIARGEPADPIVEEAAALLSRHQGEYTWLLTAYYEHAGLDTP